jgi:hypothetical protein
MNARVLSCVIAFALAGCPSNETESQLPEIATYLGDLGYSFYNPPRTDRGPLSVFRFEKAQSGKTVISPVCSKLFPNVEVTKSFLSLPQQSSKDSISLQFAAALIKDLLKDPASVSLNWASDSNVEVQYSDVRSVYVNEEDLYNPNGEPRKITPSCYSAIERIHDNGEFEGNVFVIQSAIEVGGLVYNFSETDLKGAEADFTLKKVVDLKPGVRGKFITETSLLIEEPRFFAFKAFLLKDYFFTGLASAGSAVIKAEPLPLHEVKERIN